MLFFFPFVHRNDIIIPTNDSEENFMVEKRDARGLTEAEAIARYRSKNYAKPALTADIIVLRPTEQGVQVLLVERGGHPFLGKLALPGGFANENEPVEETAARELVEETGVSGLSMELVGVFSKPGRDPRGWVVSAAFAAVVTGEDLTVQAGDDAASAQWYTVIPAPSGLVLYRDELRIPAEDLAFDHAEVLSAALKKANLL
jgi:8-oxo-dGTP diphosphatase